MPMCAMWEMKNDSIMQQKQGQKPCIVVQLIMAIKFAEEQGQNHGQTITQYNRVINGTHIFLKL